MNVKLSTCHALETDHVKRHHPQKMIFQDDKIMIRWIVFILCNILDTDYTKNIWWFIIERFKVLIYLSTYAHYLVVFKSADQFLKWRNDNGWKTLGIK